MKEVRRAGLVTGLAAALLLAGAALAAAQHHGRPGASLAAHRAHPVTGPGRGPAEAPTCEVCLQPIAAEREVVLESMRDGSQHHYRCLHCALVSASDWFAPDVTLTVHTRSVLHGTPVEWTRRGGKWSVTPPSARVLVMPDMHGECLDKHLAFADAAELQAYAEKRALPAKRLSIAAGDVTAILNAGRPPAPREAASPVSKRPAGVDAKTSRAVSQGRIYYSCSQECRRAFTSDAARYQWREPYSPPPRSTNGHSR